MEKSATDTNQNANKMKSAKRYGRSVCLSKIKRLLAAVPITDFLATLGALAAVVTIGASIVGGTVKPETLHYFWLWEIVAAVLLLVLVPLLICKTWLEYQRRKHDPALVWVFQKEFGALEDKRKEAAIVCLDLLRWHVEESNEAIRWAEVEADQRIKVEPVLDCFEDIGFYLAGDQFSDEVTHHNFFHWIRGWYSVLDQYIEYYQAVKGEKAAYIHVEELYRRTAEIEKRHGSPELLLTTKTAKLDFLREEGGEGDLKISGQLSINSGPPTRVDLTVSVVNTGTTPITISRVGAMISNSSMPMPPGISPEMAAESQLHLVSSEIGPTDRSIVELAPHGGHYVWVMQLFRRVDFEAHTSDGDKFGKGYIMLTSGTKLFFDFRLLDDEAWSYVSKPPGAS